MKKEANQQKVSQKDSKLSEADKKAIEKGTDNRNKSNSQNITRK